MIQRNTKNRVDSPAVTDAEIQQALDEPFVMPQSTLAARFKFINPPASAESIEALSLACGGYLPEDYVRFLRESNGAEESEFLSGQEQFALWCSEQVLARASGPSAEGVAEDLLLIGDDGSGGYLALKRLLPGLAVEWPVVRVHSRAEPHVLASSFTEWRRNGFPLTDGFCCLGG
jgi:hypothetical protein